MNVYFTSF